MRSFVGRTSVFDAWISIGKGLVAAEFGCALEMTGNLMSGWISVLPRELSSADADDRLLVANLLLEESTTLELELE